MRPFEPHPLLRHPHAMTLAATFWPRRGPLSAPTERLFEVEPRSRVLAHCHWQAEPRSRPALVLVHGLEGSSDSPYMLGTAQRAWAAGFSVVRLNQRNCGRSRALAADVVASLTPTLYNSGLSGDLRAVIEELVARDGLPEIFLAGFSMGGNLALKMAGEMGEDYPRALGGVVAVCPALALAECVEAIESPPNRLYHWHFMRQLKKRMHRKVRLFAERYSLDGLDGIRSIREFDDRITAPHSGYRDADDYYLRASAARVLERIRVPALVLAAADDPMVPCGTLQCDAVSSNPAISLVVAAHGGHCGFVSRHRGERFWAEARIVEWCEKKTK